MKILEVIEDKLSQYKKMKSLEYTILNIKNILERKTNLSKSEYKIEGRYKKPDSVEEKIKRKGYLDPSQINDLLGIKIVCEDETKILNIKNMLQDEYKTLEIEDYYKKDRNDGYQSLHMVCEISPDVKCEFQIKDIANELKQEYCHDRIYKNNSIEPEIKEVVNRNVNDSITKYFNGKNITMGYKLTSEDCNIFDSYANKFYNQYKQKNMTLSEKIKAAKIKATNYNKEIKKEINLDRER